MRRCFTWFPISGFRRTQYIPRFGDDLQEVGILLGGQLGLKFVLRMFEELRRQIDRKGERENLLKEILFEDKQELLKKIHELKNEPPKFTQTSFLRTDLGEDEVSFKFDKFNL